MILRGLREYEVQACDFSRLRMWNFTHVDPATPVCRQREENTDEEATAVGSTRVPSLISFEG